MFAMQKALDLISEAQERERIDKEQEGLIRETEPSPRAKAGGFDIATTMRIVMGQLTWLTRELGDLVGLCIGGIDLDALAVQILTRFNRSFHPHLNPKPKPYRRDSTGLSTLTGSPRKCPRQYPMPKRMICFVYLCLFRLAVRGLPLQVLI
jgi:hypothetical protein